MKISAGPTKVKANYQRKSRARYMYIDFSIEQFPICSSLFSSSCPEAILRVTFDHCYHNGHIASKASLTLLIAKKKEKKVS